MRVVFFGTPQFAADVLTFLLQNQINIVAVVSKPDRPKGRSDQPVATPVKQAAQSFNSLLPVYQPEKASDLDFAALLSNHQADLFVVVAYGEIMKQHLLDLPKCACINLHASLLPKYRGAAPIQRAIINGELESGVTIMHMVKKMDAGDKIKTAIVPIGPDMTFGELNTELCLVGKNLLLEVINNFAKCDEKRLLQEEALVTFAPKIELEDCEINWTNPAQTIHNLIRGVNPYPGAWCYLNSKGTKKRLKITRSKIVIPQTTATGEALPGTILNQQSSKGNLVIACGTEALELLDVQLEGKKAMSSDELTRGISRQDLSFTSL